ncbi:Pentatricopeptide repeat-containing protein [Platanthera guangdongensis]|uniref:Pentatricopeptide repeat-containing protein n=1 Tax=Platanthera guangdongensis TaxID=2320717 RepID=A0ABR2LP80_9ASPA
MRSSSTPKLFSEDHFIPSTSIWLAKSSTLMLASGIHPTLARCSIKFPIQISSPSPASSPSTCSPVSPTEPSPSSPPSSSSSSSGLRPDGFAVVGALSASARLLHNPELGRAIHALIYRRGLGRETVVGNALVDMYSKHGKIRSAEAVFAGMAVRDSVSWSSMLNGRAKCSGLDSACQLFREMPSRDAVSWTVMITRHVQEKRPIQALKLFREMISAGRQPTLITVVGVLSACADIGALDFGSAIHGYVSKMDARFDVALHNALIDMYSKSGSLQTAEEIFNGLLIKDVYTWTSMISGFAVHGRTDRAIQAFSDMRSAGVSPNKITFLAVLLACSHGGLIDEGRKLFDEMRRVYNYMPQVEHLGCMVDLLGRAGRLKEAELLVRDMGMDADCVIWRSLLSASLVHGDAELAELAGKKITEQEPGDDGVYVLLWNMYASSGRWKEAREVRKKMREMKLLKRPGCSSIEVEGIVHEFLVDDRMNLCQTEIYSVMEEMCRHMRTYSTVYHAKKKKSLDAT